MAKEYGYLVNGQWLKSENKREILNPFNNEVVGVINIPDLDIAKKSVDYAVEAAIKFKETPSYERSAILKRIVSGIDERKEEFAKTLVREGGKPLKTARLEVQRAKTSFSVAAEEANRFSGGELLPLDIIPGSEKRFGISRRFPLGVVMGISPFNFPLNLVAHKVAPAIASANALILKPASQTPISALMLGEVAIEAGLPQGLLNILPLPGGAIEPVAEDPRIKKISFTGSDVVGWELMSKHPKKKVTLELGGNAAAFEADVTKLDQLEGAAGATVDRFGGIDALVNNAGIRIVKSFQDHTEEDWRRILDVNLTGQFLTAKAVVPHLIARGKGKIVNVASIAGLGGRPNRVAYVAAKFGIVGLTRALAMDLSADNICVNALCPSMIASPLNIVLSVRI